MIHRTIGLLLFCIITPAIASTYPADSPQPEKTLNAASNPDNTAAGLENTAADPQNAVADPENALADPDNAVAYPERTTKTSTAEAPATAEVSIAAKTTEVGSPFRIQGVLEGFYGRPWTHRERLDIIRFMSEFGLQSYVYAPKDDPYHRSRWRDSYSGNALEQFEELLRTTREYGITLWYAISPGLDMVYSSEDDYRALLNKMESMIELGVRHVALFLDDVPETLNHEEDKNRFSSLGQAHVHVIRRLYEDLKARDTDLMVCPTTYTNAWGDRDYIRTLGEGISVEIPVFWTGTDVAVPEITANQAREWAEKMNRPPMIWDNFPVNDYERWRVFLGPLEGRAPDLAEHTTGIVSNPMNQPYASMIPLATLARYVHDPENYVPDDALEWALHRLYPGEAIPHIRELVTLYREPGWEDNIFAPVYTPGLPLHAATLEEGLDRFEANLHALKKLSGKPDHLLGFIDEMTPFLKNTRADLESLVTDPAFYIDENGLLRYRPDRQKLLAREAPFEITVDGSLEEWNLEGFYSIPVAEEGIIRNPEAAFLYDETHLYLGLRIYREGPLHVEEPFYPGDHITLLIDMDPGDERLWIKPQDPLIVMRPAGEEESPDISPLDFYSFDLTHFTARGVTNVTMYTFSLFFLNQAGEPADPEMIAYSESTDFAWQETDYGYSAELAVPHLGRHRIRAAVGGRVTTGTDSDEMRSYRFLLSERPYLGNTSTYPVIRLVRPD